MSDTIAAIGKHHFDMGGHLQDFGEEMIEKCMAAFGDKFDPRFGPEYGKRLYDYDIYYHPAEGYLHMTFEGPGMLRFKLHPQLVEIDDGASYSILHSGNSSFKTGWYRHEVYKMAQFLGLDQVIYLPSDRHPMAIYLEYAQANTSYDALKQKLTEEVGPPMLIRDFDVKQVIEDWEKIWVLDDFEDLR